MNAIANSHNITRHNISAWVRIDERTKLSAEVLIEYDAGTNIIDADSLLEDAENFKGSGFSPEEIARLAYDIVNGLLDGHTNLKITVSASAPDIVQRIVEIE